METNKDYTLFENYLNNKMSDEEKKLFESRLANDEKFSAEYQRHQAAHSAIDFAIAKNLKEQLMYLEAEEQKELTKNQKMQEEGKVVSMRKNRSRRLSFIRYASAAVILLLVGFYFLIPKNNLTALELADTYYKTPDYSLRGSNNTATTLTRGIDALKNKNYNKAITTLDSIGVSNGFYIPAQYFQAHALFQNKQYTDAEKRFDLVSNGKDIRYQEVAQWYSLLSCLAQNKTCTQKLNRISNNKNHRFYQQAVDIRKKLR